MIVHDNMPSNESIKFLKGFVSWVKEMGMKPYIILKSLEKKIPLEYECLKNFLSIHIEEDQNEPPLLPNLHGETWAMGPNHWSIEEPN